MITNKKQKRSHLLPLPTPSRIKAAARKCAAQIKALAEVQNDANIEAAYRKFQRTVAQIESQSRGN